MKIKLTSFYTGGKIDYIPGQIMDVDDEEGARLISVGGAVEQVSTDSAASKKTGK